MLFRFILTKIEYFYRENRYTLILLFKHLQVQIIMGSIVRGKIVWRLKSKCYLDLF